MAPVRGSDGPRVPQNLDLFGGSGQSYIDQMLREGEADATQTSGSGSSTSSSESGGTQTREQAQAEATAEAAFDAFLTPDQAKNSVFLNPDYEVNVSGEPDQYANARKKSAQKLISMMNGSMGAPGSSSEEAPSAISASSLQLNNGGIQA